MEKLFQTDSIDFGSSLCLGLMNYFKNNKRFEANLASILPLLEKAGRLNRVLPFKVGCNIIVQLI